MNTGKQDGNPLTRAWERWKTPWATVAVTAVIGGIVAVHFALLAYAALMGHHIWAVLAYGLAAAASLLAPPLTAYRTERSIQRGRQSQEQGEQT